MADTLLLNVTDSFRGPNCTQTILNNPDLVGALVDLFNEIVHHHCCSYVNNLTLD